MKLKYLILCCFLILSCGQTIADDKTKNERQATPLEPGGKKIRNELLIGVVPIWVPLGIYGQPSPRLPRELSIRKFVLSNGEETLVDFGEKQGKYQDAGAFIELYLGYRFHKFIGVFELAVFNWLGHCSSPFGEADCFFYKDRLGSAEKNGEKLFISYIVNPSYSLSLGYEIFSDLYFKIKAEKIQIDLIQGQENANCYMCPPDVKSTSIIYHDDFISWGLITDYTPQLGIANLCIILTGGLNWIDGELTTGVKYYAAIGLGYRVPF